MRKLTWIALVLVLIVCSMTGCGEKNVEPVPTPSPTPSPTAAPTPTPTPEPVAFETVVAQQPVGYTAAADAAAVHEALSAAWAEENERLEYGGENPLYAEPADGAVTLYGMEAPRQDAVGAPVSDGTYLYMLSGTTLRILRADGVNTAQLGAMEVGSAWSDTQVGQETTWGGFEKYPSRLYLAGGKLAVLSNWYGYESYMQGSVNVCDYTEYTCLDIYDLTDPVAPVLVASFGQDGTVKAADVQDGALYLVTEHTVYRDEAESDSTPLPKLYTAEGSQTMDVSSVLLPECPADSVYAVVGVYALETAARTDAKAVLGINGTAVLDAPRVYLTAERYVTGLSLAYRENIYDVSDYAVAACTDVLCLDASSGQLVSGSSTTVIGHPGGERAVAMLGDKLHLATREENYRYTLYADSEHGFENILWGDMESGENLFALSDSLQDVSGASSAGMYEGYLFNWTDGNYLGLSRDESGVLRLSLLSIGADGTMAEAAAKTFGNDYSKTLSSMEAVYINSEMNIIGFAADDGYSFYSCNMEEGGFTSLFDAYITDWPWHVRCAAVGDHLYMTDRTTVYIYSLTDMALVHTLTL